MAGENSFKKNYHRYDQWFDNNKDSYKLELEVLKKFVPKNGKGLESGVGTGKFAVPLNVEYGIDPVFEMFEKAKEQGVKTVCAKGEKLPFQSEVFDFVLAVTTICFYDDILSSFEEAFCVIKKGGVFILGFVDKGSWLGEIYQEKKEKSPFYKDAVFYSAEEIKGILELAGFSGFEFGQTLLQEEKNAVIQGYGKGGFAAIKAVKGGF